MRSLRLLGGLILTLAIASAWAAVTRHFPTVAKRGTLVFLGQRDVTLDDKPARLSVGARVLDQRNATHVLSYYTGVKAVTNYTLNPRGEIDRVWILTDAEAEQTPEEQRIQPKSN